MTTPSTAVALKTDWTNDTPAADVHAKAHADVATSVLGLLAAGSAGPAPVDLLIRQSGALVASDLGGQLFAPRPFLLSYFNIAVRQPPTGGPLTVVLIVGNSQYASATLNAGQSQVTGTVDPNGNFGGDPVLIEAGFFGYLTIFNVGSDAPGTDLTVALGGEASTGLVIGGGGGGPAN